MERDIRGRLEALDRAVEADETRLDKTLRLRRLVSRYLEPAGLHESAEHNERAASVESAE